MDFVVATRGVDSVCSTSVFDLTVSHLCLAGISCAAASMVEDRADERLASSRGLSSGIRAKVVHGTVLIEMSTSVNKCDEVAADSEEIIRPVYADNIPQNIRDDLTTHATTSSNVMMHSAKG